MNRTSEFFDDRIADWLEDDPLEAPARLLETVLAAAPSIPQRQGRGVLGAMVFRPFPRFAPVATAIVIAVLLVAGLALSVIGPPPRATPTPAASPIPLVRFDSPLYGFSISHPEGWRVTPATERIVANNPPWADTSVVDQFNGLPGGPNPNALIVAAMSEVAVGTTLNAWTDETSVLLCGTPTQPQESIEVAGLPATVSTFARCQSHFHIWVTFVRGTQAFHVVWLNFSGTEAADRQLLDRVLATFTLPRTAPAITPAATAAATPAAEPLPEALIGAWYHPAPGWWWFRRAGDPECVQAVRTELDCAVWQRGTTAREIGIASMSGGDLKVTWRSGFCTGIASTYSVALTEDSLTLLDIGGGCEGGNYAMTRAGTGSAPTSPPPPAP